MQESLLEIINGVKKNSGFYIFWQSRKTTFLKEFQESVEDLMASDKTNSEGIYKSVNKK